LTFSSEDEVFRAVSDTWEPVYARVDASDIDRRSLSFEDAAVPREKKQSELESAEVAIDGDLSSDDSRLRDGDGEYDEYAMDARRFASAVGGTPSDEWDSEDFDVLLRGYAGASGGFDVVTFDDE
jgi:hypothetical protein